MSTGLFAAAGRTGLKALGGLFASSGRGARPRGVLPDISTPAFQLGTSEADGRLNVSLTRRQTPELARRTQRRGRIFGDIDVLRQELRPGFGRFTESAVQSVRNARARALGNLRDQLSRRKVQGSSFAADTLTRAEREFAQLEQEERTRGFLAEFGATVDLLNQEFGFLSTEVQEELQQLQIASGLAGQITQGLQRSQDIAAQLAANEAAARGQFFGRVTGDISEELFGTQGGAGGVFQDIFGGNTRLEQLADNLIRSRQDIF